jgi:hypothetical protein
MIQESEDVKDVDNFKYHTHERIYLDMLHDIYLANADVHFHKNKSESKPKYYVKADNSKEEIMKSIESRITINKENVYSRKEYNELKSFKHDNITHEILTFRYNISKNTNKIIHRFGSYENLYNHNIIDFSVDVNYQGYRKLNVTQLNAIDKIELLTGGMVLSDAYLFKYKKCQQYFDLMENDNVLPKLSIHNSDLIFYFNPDYEGEFEFSYEIVKVLNNLNDAESNPNRFSLACKREQLLKNKKSVNLENDSEYVFRYLLYHFYSPIIALHVFINKKYNCIIKEIKLDGKYRNNYNEYIDDSLERKPWHFQLINSTEEYDHYYFECDNSFSINPYTDNCDDYVYICFNKPYLSEYSDPIVIGETKNIIYYANGMAGSAFSK